MLVNRVDFLKELSSVQSGISTQEDFVQSSCFLFQDGNLMTLNEEIFCKRPTVATEIKGAVSAEPLLQLLNKLKEDEIDIRTDGTHFIVKGKNKEAGVNMEKKIEAPIKEVDAVGAFKKLNPKFLEAVSLVHQCASTDTSQFSLTCLNMTPTFIEACDNWKLTRFKLETGFEEPIMVKQKSMKHISGLGVTRYSITQSFIHFKNKAGLIISCRRYVDDYPDLTRFLEMKGTRWAVPKGLKAAADLGKIFSGDGQNASHLKMILTPGKVRLEAHGEKGYFKQARKIEYDGKKIKFKIHPAMLIELVDKHNNVLINPHKLKVNGGEFEFVASLEPIEEKESENDEASED